MKLANNSIRRNDNIDQDKLRLWPRDGTKRDAGVDLKHAKDSKSYACADGGHAFIRIGVGAPQGTELPM